MFSKLFCLSRQLAQAPRRFVAQYVKHNTPFDDSKCLYSNKLTPALLGKDLKQIPTFRVIDLKGYLVAPQYDNISMDLMKKIYDIMLKTEEFDTICNMAQRQGKISFYMPSFGEYATTITVGAALDPSDTVYSQYREQGTLFFRGYDFESAVNQLTGNYKDPGKGRQMPVHYGVKDLNWFTISSPLGTQIPQASGSGYVYRLTKADKVVACYFGEGCASVGDFHAAMNFAATLQCQTLFLCRNNHYAISTPSDDQYTGYGIAERAVSYGIQTYRVDGNDVLAVYNTVAAARKYIIENRKPAFVEFMSYRIGDHSTSDHSALYRSEEEINSWKTQNNPITRFGNFLRNVKKVDLDPNYEANTRKEARSLVSKKLAQAITEPGPAWQQLFEDVYDTLTPNLIKQKSQLEEAISKHPEAYHVEKLIKQ